MTNSIQLHPSPRDLTDEAITKAAIDPHCEPIISSARRKEWLAARSSLGLTASDVASALGLNPRGWRGPLDVWLDKREPAPIDKPPSPVMRRGLALQSFLLSELEVAVPGMRAIEDDTLYRSRHWPWLLATPDGISITADGEVVVLEVKDVGWRVASHWDKGIPIYVEAQVATQCMVLGTEFAYVGAWLGDRRDPFKAYAYELTDPVRDFIVEGTARFWASVQSGKMPEVEAETVTSEVLSRLYPRDSGQTIRLPPGSSELAEIREQQAVIERNAKQRREDAEKALKLMLGEASVGLLPGGGKLTYKQTKKGHRQLRRGR